MKRDIFLPTRHGRIAGYLGLPPAAQGLVLLALPDEDSLDNTLAEELAGERYAVLSMALLAASEAGFPDYQHNVPLLTERLVDALALVRNDADTENLPLGLLAAGSAVPAAIRAAAQRDGQVKAVACHGGVIDRAGRQSLDLLAAPLLMLVDAGDSPSMAAFQRAAPYLTVPHRLITLEPGENPRSHIVQWFGEYLQAI